MFNEVKNLVIESPSSSRSASSPGTTVPDYIPAESRPDSEQVVSPATNTHTTTENNCDITPAPDSTEFNRSTRTIRGMGVKELENNIQRN